MSTARTEYDYRQVQSYDQFVGGASQVICIRF